MRLPKKVLTAQEIKNLKRTGAHAVGTVSGLYLRVDDEKRKSWFLRVLIGNRRRSMGLGSYPSVTLAEATLKAREARELIEEGVDPIERRKELKSGLNTLSFSQALDRYIQAKGVEWKNAKHLQQWTNSFANDARQLLDIPVNLITTQHILNVLEPIWIKKTVTAKRIRGRIEVVLDWATVRKYRQGENPARWRGHLEALLASPNKISKVKHHKAIDWREMSNFMRDLSQIDGVGALALKFLVLTASRTSEVINAQWNEFDLVNKVWVIPAHRMKANREHRVPLSNSVITLLQSLEKRSKWVFPSTWTNEQSKPLSNMAMLNVLKVSMKSNFTVHGFRSTFRDWCAEMTNFPREVCESALAHHVGGQVELAYRRTDFFDKREKLMQMWDSFLQNSSSTVLHLNKKASNG
jgi:integrase